VKANEIPLVEAGGEEWRLECEVRFARGAFGRKTLRVNRAPRPDSPGRVPRVARLLALAHRFDALLQSGEVQSCADLALLAHISRSRVTQIMNLLHLAPDIQEAILDLPPVTRGPDPITESSLRPISVLLEWGKQRRVWTRLVEQQGVGGFHPGQRG
jgi:hypothetical protein